MENTIFYFVVLCCFLELTSCGFTKDGGYIGKYPGGCVQHDECPIDENCIHDELEELCPDGDEKNCRCMMGCVYKGKYLRFQQWRPIEGDGACMCLKPGRYGKFGENKDQGGIFKCSHHVDL